MALEETLKQKRTELATLKNNVKTLRAELEAQGEKALADDKTKLNTMVDSGFELQNEVARLEKELELTREHKVDEATASSMARNGGLWLPRKSWGQAYVESEAFKKRLTGQSDRVKMGTMPRSRKDLYEGTDATGGATIQNQHLPEVIDVARQRELTILDLVNRSRTSVDAVEYAEKSTRTNNAAVKAEYNAGWVSAVESDITFLLKTANVKTIATYVEASMQLLDDSPRMQDLIDNELLYMVAVKLEDQVIAGDGTGNNFTGLNAWAGIQTRVHQDVGARGASADDTVVDTIRRGITDIILELYKPDGIILNPADGEKLELDKDDNGQYTKIYDATANRIWRVPIIETVAQTSGTATVGAFKMAATLWDRQEAQVRAGQPGDLFLQLAFAVIAYIRAAFAVVRPLAIEKITGLV